jgi:hypothetical protein
LKKQAVIGFIKGPWSEPEDLTKEANRTLSVGRLALAFGFWH